MSACPVEKAFGAGANRGVRSGAFLRKCRMKIRNTVKFSRFLWHFETFACIMINVCRSGVPAQSSFDEQPACAETLWEDRGLHKNILWKEKDQS